jgi:hypothetical protein
MYNVYIIIGGTMMATEATKRINVTFPVSLLEELRRYVPRRERSKFIVEATEKELKRTRLVKPRPCPPGLSYQRSFTSTQPRFPQLLCLFSSG